MVETQGNQSNGARSMTRDPRLDVFRGLGMFIILIAHIPRNELASWIPARFGFSDATEIFVFCSGAASALAFGPAFDRLGWFWGAKRIARRMWEVYRSHVGVFIAVVVAIGLVDVMLPGSDYLRERLNLGPFLDAPSTMLTKFISLSYVPNYFDILPMYLVILGLIPIMMFLASLSVVLAIAISLSMWLAATVHLFELRAEPWSDRPWFFNPFAWQLVFFTGFAFVRGWIPAPPYHRGLLLFCVLILSACAPVSCHYGFSCYSGWGYFPVLGEIHEGLGTLIDKPHFGALRYVHFLAVAYVAYVLAGERGTALRHSAWDKVAEVGRQTLAVFLSGLVVAQLLGVVLDVVDFSGVSAVVNVVGCVILYCVARFMTFWKALPPRDGDPKAGRSLAAVCALVAGIGTATGAQSGEVRKLLIPSPSLRRELPVSVYVPGKGAPWPVLYLLHGTNGSETDWPVMGDVSTAMNKAIAEGALPPALVVMPNGENSWYVDNPDPGGAGLFAQALIKDLPDAIELQFPTRACAQFRAIGGVSMGGYGALLHAMDNPNRYASAFAMSAALWKPWSTDAEAGSARPTRMFRNAYGDPFQSARFNASNVFLRLNRYAKDPGRAAIKLAIGSNDFKSLQASNRDFVSALADLGVIVPLSVDDGGHDWSLWARQLPEMLQWLGLRWINPVHQSC